MILPPKIVIPTKDMNVEWTDYVPLVPRHTRGTRHRMQSKGAARPFSPQHRCLRSHRKTGGGEDGAEGPASGRGAKGDADQKTRRTPTGRRRRRAPTEAVPFNAGRPALWGDDSDAVAAPANPFAASGGGSGADAAERPAARTPGARTPGVKTPAARSRRVAPGSGAGGTGGRRSSMGFRTPAPPKPQGEQIISKWLKDTGLEAVAGLVDALAGMADDLGKLAALRDDEISKVVSAPPVELKGIKLRKLLATVRELRAEASAFAPSRRMEFEWREGIPERPLEAPLDLASSVTRITMHDMPPPPRPKIGDLRLPANQQPPRFRPRTNAEELETADAETADPDVAAVALGVTGPSEARELSELADLFGTGGSTSSGRDANALAANALAARAAAKAATTAAAAAMQVAARASEKLIEAAAAKAKRVAAGVEDATPRSQLAASALAMDLQQALDEAVGPAIASALEEEVAIALGKKRKAKKGKAKEPKVPTLATAKEAAPALDSARGGLPSARGGAKDGSHSARGGNTTAWGGNTTARGGNTTARGEKKATKAKKAAAEGDKENADGPNGAASKRATRANGGDLVFPSGLALAGRAP